MDDNKLMKRLLIVSIFIGQVLTGYSFCSTDSTKEIRLRIKNSSKYHIIKVTILGQTIDNIKPGKKSDYFLVEPFYPSFKVDITFVKKGQVKTAPWEHVITYPIDHVGERLIDNRKNTVVIEISEGETVGQFEIDTWIKKE
jgi:hypothetical protein